MTVYYSGIELELSGQTPYLIVAMITFVAFLMGLSCIMGLQIFVEKAFADEEANRKSDDSGVS